MLRAFALLVGSVAFLSAPAASAADEPKDIVARAIKAHGGEEFLTKHKAIQMRNKGKADLPGVGEVEFTEEMTYMSSDKLKDSVELTVGGMKVPVLVLVNGDKVQVTLNGEAFDAPDTAKAALKETARVMHVARLVPLTDKGYELSLIGDDKVEGKEVVGVRVSKKDQKDISLYFDKKTDLLVKMVYSSADIATGNEVTDERIHLNYEKNKDGIPVPKRLLMNREGKKLLDAEVLEFTYQEKIDDGEFKK